VRHPMLAIVRVGPQLHGQHSALLPRHPPGLAVELEHDFGQEVDEGAFDLQVSLVRPWRTVDALPSIPVPLVGEIAHRSRADAAMLLSILGARPVEPLHSVASPVDELLSPDRAHASAQQHLAALRRWREIRLNNAALSQTGVGRLPVAFNWQGHLASQNHTRRAIDSMLGTVDNCGGSVRSRRDQYQREHPLPHESVLRGRGIGRSVRQTRYLSGRSI